MYDADVQKEWYVSYTPYRVYQYAPFDAAIMDPLP